mmetsp:Transcript_47727/g.88537  ORF Transcript_47727/g.88537 Transcript_47727/m.88537 type:complete len:90 (+) Transcript_47727:544-813(+)
MLACSDQKLVCLFAAFFAHAYAAVVVAVAAVVAAATVVVVAARGAVLLECRKCPYREIAIAAGVPSSPVDAIVDLAGDAGDDVGFPVPT